MQDALSSPPDATTPQATVAAAATAMTAPRAPLRSRGALVAVVAVVLATFALIAPTLTWLEFSSGSENLNVATALEILREDRWLVPTLEGEARVAKPPLTAWITATAIDSDTFAGMSSRDADIRAAAERELAWQVRWPFLLASCLMLLATAELGRVLSGGDWRVGAIAAAACASNLFFLRHGRLATTDVQLALWVALANVCLAHAVMRGRWWTGAMGAGLTLGLAFMSKGPVALVQSVAPFAVFVLIDAWFFRTRRRDEQSKPLVETDASPWGTRLLQILLAIALFALVALPWYAVVAAKNPDVWARWQMEVTREGATDLPPGKPYAYLSFFGFIAPWTAFVIAGIAVILRDVIGGSDTPVRHAAQPRMHSEEDRAAPDVGQECPTHQAECPTHRMKCPASGVTRGMLLALLMVFVPILIMSFFRDRKERYLLPMIVPAGVVIARAVVEHLDTRHRKNAADRAVVGIHWATLLVIAIGLPVAGVVALKTLDGNKWFSPAVALIGGVVGLAIVVAGLLIHRRWGGGLVAATLLLMLAMQVLFMHGYRHSREGRSEMKPLAALIWQRTPDASIYITGPKKVRAPVDLAIYLNRSVPWVDDVSQIPRGGARPIVVVTRQRRREPPPEPPARSAVVGKTARDENWWHAFLLP
jgi:4-amino-4-deoxy-L-arabinose transferase-like glycosyltransferase